MIILFKQIAIKRSIHVYVTLCYSIMINVESFVCFIYNLQVNDISFIIYLQHSSHKD